MLSIFTFALVAALSSLGVSAQSFCGGAGYDLTAAVQTDMSFVSGQWNYWIHPCGSISSTSELRCALPEEAPFGSMFCQKRNTNNDTFVLANYNDTVARYSTQWLAQTNGVMMTIQNGDRCDAIGNLRMSSVNFVCNNTATTPWFASVTEPQTCWYIATVHTSAACSRIGVTMSNAVGSSFYSHQCGGGVFDLSSLSSQDLYYNGPGYDYWVRICGIVANSSCAVAQPTSFCQLRDGAGAIAVDVSDWDVANATREPAIYTITDTGMTIEVRSGANCGGNGPRRGTYKLVCNSKIQKPVLSYVVETQTCHYTAIIQTPAVCTGTNDPAQGYCGGAGYDLSGLNGVDLTLNANGYNWVLHPCGVISPWYSAGCGGKSSMMCQMTGTTGGWNLASWNKTVADAATWVAITNGVQLYVQTGEACGGQLRDTTIKFICNTTAINPWFKSVTEPEVCWYVAEVHTEWACDTVGATMVQQPGFTYFDQTCGGEYWDVSDIRDQEDDLVWDTNSTSSTDGFVFYLELCGQVSHEACDSVQPTMFCQYSKAANESYSITKYDPTTAAQYTINENGFTMKVSDGTPCGNFNRTVSMQVICDGANPAFISSVREVEMCHYNVLVHGRCTRGSTEPFSSSSSRRPRPSSSTGRSSTGGSGSTGAGGVPESSSSSSLSGGAIAGIVIGSIAGALILLAILAVVCCGALARGGSKKTGERRFDDMEKSRDGGEVEMEDTHD